MNTNSILRQLAVSGRILLCLNSLYFPVTIRAADEPGVSERTKAVVEDTKQKAKDATAAVEGAVKDAKEAVTDATRSAGEKFQELWKRVDESRLKNRTRDEIVAWVIMGVLVGAVAGMMTSLKTTGLGKLGRLLLGLAGAFLGGVVVHVANVDFGMGPVLIRYEELLFSFGGAISLLLAVRLLRSSATKKPD